MATLRLSRPWSGHPMVSISPPGAMIRQYKYGMLPLDPACSPIVATLILYMRWLSLLMANILSPGARIIQHKCGKRSDGGREAGNGTDNFPLALVVDGANRHDVRLLSATLDGLVIS